MRRDARMYLSDIQAAARRISEYTSGKQFSNYQAEEMLRDAVERRFEIIGVALVELPPRTRGLPTASATTGRSSHSAISWPTGTRT